MFVCVCVCVCAFVRACVCICVCVSAPEDINNQWRDIGCVRLVKQVSGFFLLLITLYMTLAVDKMDGRGHINTARGERQLKKTKVTWY